MGTLVDVKIPDIGDFSDVDVIEVMIKPGDRVGVEDPLITIESDKASMEVPSPFAGIVKELKVKLGDKVSEGSPVVAIETSDTAAERVATQAPPPKKEKPTAKTAAAAEPFQQERPKQAAKSSAQVIPIESASEGERVSGKPHGSPSVRKFARELGGDLSELKGSGLHGRIFRADVEQFVKSAMKSARPAAASLNLAPWPKVDFARLGESKPARFPVSSGFPGPTSRATGS